MRRESGSADEKPVSDAGQRLTAGPPLDRRAIMLGSLAMATAAGDAHAAYKGPRISQELGLQMLMFGREAAKDLPDTLKKIREIGYRKIEGSPPPGVSPQAFHSALDQAGLTCPSTMMSYEADRPGQVALSDPAGVIAFCKAIGATNVVVNVVPFTRALAKRPDAMALMSDMPKLGAFIVEFTRSLTDEDWSLYARQLNEGAAKLATAGIRVAYHNHNTEFEKLANGQTPLDLLIAKTDPKLVDLEVDLGWVKAAGVEPAAFLRRHGPRIRQVHLKDLKATPANTHFLFNTSEVGKGVQDWAAIAEALKSTALQHAYVEQEPPYEVSGLQSAANAYAFIQPLLTKKGL